MDSAVTDSVLTGSGSLPPQVFAVTGATGYLGSRLARRLHQRGHTVVVLKRSRSNVARIADILPDLRSYDVDVQPVDAIFEKQRYSCLLHCATDYGRTTGSRPSVIDANLVLPLRLLDAAIRHGTPFFVNTDTVLDTRVSDYSLSKRQFREYLAKASASICGINVAIEHFYGPADDASKFVGGMVRRLLAGDARIGLTPGAQLRDFVYIDDVVAAFEKILEHNITSPQPAVSGPVAGDALRCYEVGSGSTVSIREFMTTLCRLAGREHGVLEFGAIQYRENEVMHSQARVAPLLSLGWKPQVGLEEGLWRTLVDEQLRMRSARQCAI